VVDKDGFARAVAHIHAADLGDGDVGFVDDEKVVVREKVEQGGGRGAGRTAGDVARVVLDAGAKAHLFHHLEVVFGAHLDALGLEELAVFLKPDDAFAQFLADGEGGDLELVVGGDELFGGEDGDGGEVFDFVAGEGFEAGEALDLLAEKFEAQAVLAPGGTDLHGVAANAEVAALEGDVVAGILEIDEPAEELVAGEGAADGDGDDHGGVVLLAADAVDAGDAGDDNDVAPGEEGAHGGEAEALDLGVDAGVLLDEGVGARYVGLRLVEIEVADEIFDGVVGEKGLELGVQLGGEGFVVGDDEGGPVKGLDDVGDGEGLAGTGDTEEGLVADAVADAPGQEVDGLGLVAGRLIGRNEFEHDLELTIKGGNKTKKKGQLIDRLPKG